MVILKTLMSRDEVGSSHGRLLLSMSIVQDLIAGDPHRLATAVHREQWHRTFATVVLAGKSGSFYHSCR
jgi:Kef-type K+ transport system membrane component KefB